MSINSICVCFIPNSLLDSFGDEGDFPYCSFRWAAKFEDSTALPRERTRIEQTLNSQPVEIGFGDHSEACDQAIWIDLPDSLSYEEAKRIGDCASFFVRGWIFGKLSSSVECK